MIALILPLGAGLCQIRFLCAIGIVVGLHLAIRPHQLAVYVHIRASGVVRLRLAAKSKQLRAGRIVPFCCDMIAARDVKDVLIRSHVAVVDVQRLLI